MCREAHTLMQRRIAKIIPTNTYPKEKAKKTGSYGTGCMTASSYPQQSVKYGEHDYSYEICKKYLLYSDCSVREHISKTYYISHKTEYEGKLSLLLSPSFLTVSIITQTKRPWCLCI
jgi:hypothetical protein